MEENLEEKIKCKTTSNKIKKRQPQKNEKNENNHTYNLKKNQP